MDEQFKKERVLEILGGTQAAADFFKCRSQAISQWPSDKPIPKARQYELMARLPDKFPACVA